MRNKSTIKNIIWDFNGTLLNDVSICLASINPLLKNRGLTPLNKKRYQEVFTFPVIEYYKTIGFNFEEEPFEIPAMQFIHNYRMNLPKAKLFSGILELLNAINKTGKDQFVLSAMEEPFLIETLKELNIFTAFKAIAGIPDHYAHSKVERGLRLFNDCSINPKETLLIGDTLHDYEVANELGVQCILLSYGHYAKERLMVNGNVVLDNLDQLKEIVVG